MFSRILSIPKNEISTIAGRNKKVFFYNILTK